jgi:putative FmdB family regulatory protein
MPLYEYECDACGHRFEVIQKFSDPPVNKCPNCAGPVHKLIASPAIQFKGSGWYITDYARKDSARAGKTGESKDSSSAEPSTSSDKTASTNAGSSSATPATTPKKD